MSYVAIARRYRPNSFHEMAGQSHVTRTLKNAIERDRVHHAYLFSGPRGVGKTTSARALARAINCEQGPTPNPCGVCTHCVSILEGNSADVKEIDGASNNSVESVRSLREEVQYLPQSRKRIFIIDEVHMLSNHAFNALLKTLEEPPAHVMFIFATTEPNNLPDTILSRCQRFEFKRIPMSTVVSYLANICQSEGIQIDEGGLRLIARAGEGSMRDSQSLLDQVISFAGREITTEQVANALGLVDRAFLYTMLRGLIKYDAALCLEAINSVYDAGYDLAEFASEMLELLRNATLVVLSKDSFKFVDIPEDERLELESLAKESTPDVFTRSFQVMLDVHEQVSRSPRPKLALEMSVARLMAIRPAHSIDDLISKITKMQGGGVPRTPKTQNTKTDDDGITDHAKQSGFLSPSSSQRQPRVQKKSHPTSKPSGFLPTSGNDSVVHEANRTQTPTIRPGYGMVSRNSTKPVSTIKPVSSTTPAPAPPSPEEQFLGFVRAVKSQGDVGYDVIDHLAYHSTGGSRVEFVTPHKFHLSRISNLRNDPFWQDSLEQFFSVRNFSVRVRKSNEQMETPTERQDRLNEAQSERLRTAFMKEQTFELLSEMFDARITKVHLDTPIPKGQ